MVRLPSQVAWDSHNYITMTADRDGYLHLSGNMHVAPLVYFGTAKPYDIHSRPVITPSRSIGRTNRNSALAPVIAPPSADAAAICAGSCAAVRSPVG